MCTSDRPVGEVEVKGSGPDPRGDVEVDPRGDVEVEGPAWR